MKKSAHRFWGLPQFGLFHQPDDERRVGLSTIRAEVLATLGDCHCDRSQHLANRVMRARTPDDLWTLRSDIHQCISQTYTQSEASSRINRLAPLFKGWVPASQLGLI